MIKIECGIKNFKSLKRKLKKIERLSEPFFSSYEFDLERVYEQAAKCKDVENFIIAAQGGAVTSFLGMWSCLGVYFTTKNVFFLTTTDPDYINFLKKKCDPGKSLLVAISSSGENVNQLEMVLAFKEYKKLVIRANSKSALAKLAEQEGVMVIESPDIPDRFAGAAELALAPASLVYIPMGKILKGYKEMKEKYLPAVPIEENSALQFAASLFLLEEKGYDEVYTLIYSQQLAGFSEFVMQMMHETVCKEGKGDFCCCSCS